MQDATDGMQESFARFQQEQQAMLDAAAKAAGSPPVDAPPPALPMPTQPLPVPSMGQSAPTQAPVDNRDTADTANSAEDPTEAADQFLLYPTNPAGPPPPAATVDPAFDGWAIDPERVAGFTNAITQAKMSLDGFAPMIQIMQNPDYVAKLGTSPVGQQLAEMFADRLSGDDGFRGRLAEEVQRLQDWIHLAEQTLASYAQSEQDARDVVAKAHPDAR